MPIKPERETFTYEGWEVVVADAPSTRHGFYGVAGKQGRGRLATTRFFGNGAFLKAKAAIRQMIDADRKAEK